MIILNVIFDDKLLQICVLTRILENLQMFVKLVILFFQVTLTSCFSRGAWRTEKVMGNDVCVLKDTFLCVFIARLRRI